MVLKVSYHAGLEKKIREENQDKFLKDECDVIVATIAFGMGIDKPDIRYVVHYSVLKVLKVIIKRLEEQEEMWKRPCLMYYSYKDVEKLEKLLSKKNLQRETLELCCSKKFLLLQNHLFREENFCLITLGKNMIQTLIMILKWMIIQRILKKKLM